MPTDALIDFFEALCRHRLLPPEQLDEMTRELWPQASDPRALARELIRRGWLTPYQANHLLQGHGDRLVLGQYVLLERLGEGGMGQVFKARHLGLGRVVALKLVRKERLTNPDAVRRFYREIQLAARLCHPNVVQSFDADEVDGRHFYIMEYVQGIDLSRLVKQKGPLSVAEACEFVRQAALGLQHAHEHGLIHRDIKPANLLLTGRSAGPGRPAEAVIKVLDMGLARLLESPEEGESGAGALTREGIIIGTPDYIAPEQARDAHAVDIRADLYSLGCTFHFLLTAQVPFPGRYNTEKLIKHQLEPPPPLSRFRADVPPAVAEIVGRLLAKRPEDRFQTPAELALALAGGVAGLPVATPAGDTVTTPAAPVAIPVAPAPSSQDTLDSPFADLATTDAVASSSSMRRLRPAPRRAWWVVAVVGALVALGLISLAALLLTLFLT
jgi:eukaryotic-like serine/threonine-protein kinase